MNRHQIIYVLLFGLFCSIYLSCTSTTDENTNTKGQTLALTELAADQLPEHFYKRMIGIVDGKESVVLHLIRSKGTLSGTYYSTQRGEAIGISENSSVDNAYKINIKGDFARQFLSNPAAEIENFRGTFVSDRRIKGAVKIPQKNDPLTMELREVYDDQSTSLDLIHFTKQSKGDCDQSPCITFKMLYPEIPKQTKYSTLSKNFNRVVQERIQTYFGEWLTEEQLKKTKGLEENVDLVIKDFETMVAEEGERMITTGAWEMNISTEVWSNENNILSVGLNDYSYMGGAHPNSFVKFLNFNIKTGKTIQLADVFTNFAGDLRTMVIKELKKQAGKPTNVDLKDAGFFKSDADFELGDNYYFTPAALHFYYNTYEIASYAQGPIEVHIPFAQLNNLIKTDGLLAGYAKH